MYWDSGMQFSQGGADGIVEGLEGIAFVAAAVEAEGGMVADAEDVVAGVAEEHGVVIGVGAVPGIGQPEILP